MKVVKAGMGHKELTESEYSSIWEECYKEVLYVPSQNRYTRASMARLEEGRRKKGAFFAVQQVLILGRV